MFTCDDMLPILNVVRLVLNIIQWVVPIVLILMGTIDLVKAVTQSKEDDIKKAQKTLISRVIAAVVVFLVPVIVGVIMGLIGTAEYKACWAQAKGEVNIKDYDKTSTNDSNGNNSNQKVQ